MAIWDPMSVMSGPTLIPQFNEICFMRHSVENPQNRYWSYFYVHFDAVV